MDKQGLVTVQAESRQESILLMGIQERGKEEEVNYQSVCGVCGKSYSHPSNLARHKKSHEAGAKPYKKQGVQIKACKLCGKKVKARGMKMHMTRMHNSSNIERLNETPDIYTNGETNQDGFNIEEKTGLFV